MEEKYLNINQKLIKACIKGSSKAQFELYRLYSKAMYATSVRILKDSTEAEDAMQEGFLKAFQNIRTYSGNVSFGAWLKKIIVNTCLDLLRKRKLEFEDIDNVKISVDFDENEEEDFELRVETVKKAIMALPDGYRIVLSLYLLEGYDHEEIGEILNINTSTSRSQLTRAKKKLLESLKTVQL